MEVKHKESSSEKEEDGQAIIQMWRYIFRFTEMAAIKCAIDLKIADIIESYGSPVTLSQLSSTLNCSSSLLYRILRFLIHRGIFKRETIDENQIGYSQTPMSRLLATNVENSMAPLLLLETSPVMLAPWQHLSAHLKNSDTSPFEIAHGKDLWNYAEANHEHNLLFNEAMACSAKVIVSAIIEGCGDVFDGVGCLVDVGGGNGSTLNILVKVCPWMKGINFDLPHVVCASPQYENVEHVAGNMFDFVPHADVAFLKWILHDWEDEECIKILKKCKEAIPKSGGKVIIIEAIIIEAEKGEKMKKKLSDVGLMFDLVMMAHTNKGRERTAEEWAFLIHQAGFTRHTITPLQAIQSLIQCFP
ncbi:(RS)-norcoclaurine 6-O-methyltransferase-like [Cucumis melo var. makuwa]|uniref:(RS)-norcoclaurine 6-O-methyltransferase-like n=1 Tax=Cucumis melo var. makuwa TaxID=1194695 RepID=A0A5A7TGF8_CUCMM|nr:(RS)-norcoclaurine 6-O-methyltransferase-like [Cucumis melo var. makuwa]TYK23355.1 (RS)-norcoclaurine 6-O-methyltransferase-like [Cucumis melo var. makuwa]